LPGWAVSPWVKMFAVMGRLKAGRRVAMRRISVNQPAATWGCVFGPRAHT
jgi:hypothetical protein